MPSPIGNPSPPSPPSDNGQRLATIRRGPDAELRVVLVEGSKDRPGDWVSIRAWSRAETGELWPKPGRYVGLDLAELPMIIEGLKSAMTMTQPVEVLEPIRAGMRAVGAVRASRRKASAGRGKS